MTFLTDLTHNIIFMSAITGWFVAQVLKTIIHIIVNKQFVAERLPLRFVTPLQSNGDL